MVTLIGGKTSIEDKELQSVTVSWEKDGRMHISGGLNADQMALAAFHLARVANMMLDAQMIQGQQNDAQIAAIAANPKRTD